jgi:hypothetical protein
MKEFIGKIALQFDGEDFKQIKTKDGFIATLTAYGCPKSWISEITDENWEGLRDIVYDSSL